VPEVLANLGLDFAREEDLPAARAVMVSLIGDTIATAETILAVHRRNPKSIIVFRENGEITGTTSFLLLRAAGLLSIATDKFNGLAPDMDLIAGLDETPIAAYGWGIAAKTRRAAAAVLVGIDRVRNDLYPNIPFFARTLTADGQRVVCGRLRYLPFPRSKTGLLWSAPNQGGTGDWA
jgi:hypothetical protein